MKKNTPIALLLALALALVPLTALADGDAPEPVRVTVSTVDEFLDAIASNTEITLAPGLYDLSKAKDLGGAMGDRLNYYWEEVYDGYGLVIRDAESLSIIGSEGTEIVTPYAYADVIRFSSCCDVLVKGITAGHAVKPGSCCGDVLEFSGSCTSRVEGCRLYGCGEVGIYLDSMDTIDVVDCDIYSCSYAGVYAISSAYVNVDSCRIYDCGKNEYSASALFSAYNCYGFSAVNCDVHDNCSGSLMYAYYTQGAYLGGCAFTNNQVQDSAFAFTECPPVIESCSFDLPAGSNWFDPQWSEGNVLRPVDRSGAELSAEALSAMTCAKVDYDGSFTSPMPAVPKGTPLEDGRTEYRVSTVDELLASLGSDRVIVLEQPLYNLADSTGYGCFNSMSFYWQPDFDGPGLVIRNVGNLTIRSEAGATILAEPRYVNVLGFEYCSDITLENVTLGHTESAELNSCSGGVLNLQCCSSFTIDSCHLFGCGIMGISAWDCFGINVTGSEIYDCSQGAITLFDCTDFALSGCSIHDCGSPAIYVDDNCFGVTYDGLSLNRGSYEIAA